MNASVFVLDAVGYCKVEGGMRKVRSINAKPGTRIVLDKVQT
jgi:hypothetical protein